MMRKVFFVAALALVATLAGHGTAVSLRAGADEKKPAAKAPYVHTVIFYLKEDAPKGEAASLIADAHGMLAKIDTVREIRAGRPADKSTPKFAKKDYDVGLVIFFDDFDGLKTYLDHPMHQKYVEKHTKHIDAKKMQVYDFIDQAK